MWMLPWAWYKSPGQDGVVDLGVGQRVWMSPGRVLRVPIWSQKTMTA